LTQQNIDFGSGAEDDGEFIATAFRKIQENFDELFAEATLGGISVTDYGAVADATIDPDTHVVTPGTDNTAAFRRAIDAAHGLGHNTIFVPPSGHRKGYYFKLDGTSLDPGDHLTVFGLDSTSTNLIYETVTTGTSRYLFRSFDAQPDESVGTKGVLSFRGVTFKGMWSNIEEAGLGSPIFVRGYKGVHLDDVGFYDITEVGCHAENCAEFTAYNIHGERSVADVLFVRGSFRVIVDGFNFKGCDDDTISAHQHAAYTGSDIREGLIFNNINLEDCCGFKALGGREMKISNVISRRQTRTIAVTYDASEGNCQSFGLDFSNIQVFDALSYPPGTQGTNIINISPAARLGGSSTSNIVPGEPASDGTFPKPWDYRNVAPTTSGASVPAPYFVNINNVTIARTLPAVSNYSDWGYGEAFTRTGLIDPQIQEGDLRPGILMLIGGDLRQYRFNNITLNHAETGVFFNGIGSDLSQSASIISGFSVSDMSLYPFIFDSISGDFIKVVIDGCSFDVDPLHTNSNRGSGGTWATNGFPYVIRADSGIIPIFQNCAIANVCRISTATAIYGNGNTLFCNPSALGFSTANKGIGNVPAPDGDMWAYQIYDADPTSATYGNYTSTVVKSASAMPSSGWYPAGWSVRDTSPSTANHRAGWVRLTTGTGHTLNTDWLELGTTRGPSSSANNSIPRWDGTTGNLLKNTNGATIDDSGNITATSFIGPLTGNADSVTWANEASDTTCFVGFATAASGSLAPKTNTNLTFNASTGVLTSASSVLTTTDINGGTIDGTIIGGSSAAAGSFTTVAASSNISISSSDPVISITDTDTSALCRVSGNNATGSLYLFADIGASVANSGVYFNVDNADRMRVISTDLAPTSNDGLALGTTALGWADLHGATGFTWNIANGNWLATHTSGILTVGTGDLRVTNNFTNATSVATLSGAQTLANKTIALGSNTVSGSVADFNTALTGADFYTSGGTDVALADGGTGASLSDPNIDLVMGWDDSAGAVKFMALADINTEATPASGDFILIYDAAGNLLKTDWSNIPAGTPTAITVANEATDTTCFPLFATAATGDLGPKTNANITFNSNTGVLTSASSVLTTTDINGGTIDGTVIGASSAANATITTCAVTSALNVTAPSVMRYGFGSGALTFGADVNATTVTNSTRKLGRITAPTYDTSQVNSFLIGVDNDGSQNNVFFGGTPGASNTAATLISFVTAASIGTTGGTLRATIDGNGNFAVGSAALATNATNGFLYVPTCPGTPTGTPTSKTGLAPIVIDSTNNKLYFYSGSAWRDAGP
jgi:hypothetical protein